MAEQSSRDVVDQTVSGGEPSPSGVPASTNDNHPAGGAVGDTEYIATNPETQPSFAKQPINVTRETLDLEAERSRSDKDASASLTDSSKQGAGMVASRALELNGVASGSDGGDDTASQGGSESDTSRTDGKQHLRAGSVKKPATFKPVSFAKFAVPKAPGVVPPPKVPEKVPSASTTPLGAPQPSSRPRLVAKTTAGMRDPFSKTGPGGANPGASGPDPNQVWNKNRPAQPTPPKHLTDEELKQQYGIHMTSRIQGSNGGTEAKWADIDDDEDDWAPETIEWTDGTKVTLTHNEPMAPQDQPQEEPKEAPAPEPTATEQESVKVATPKPTTSVGANPTVLRLGANAERQAKTSISSKGTNDRLPSGSTSPAPPAKSPWATLPPVERVSPVNPSMPPPPQLPSQPRAPTSHPPRDDGYHASLPPREIAADDFNRTWREGPPGAPRELYNSRSGRYEPVADTRRPSWRQDQAPRAPPVLQKPSHGDFNGPAEPSAAFQTHRSSHHQDSGMGWPRRRTSSNLSGGSGQFSRRGSWASRTEAPSRFIERRGSQVNGMADPASALGGFPPSFQYSGPGRASHSSVVSDGSFVEQPQQQPQQQQPQQQQQQPPTPTAPEATLAPTLPQEDPVALQERIMKEKRMEARQRRLEEEAKEQAAKEERIRQKLAGLGPAPDKTKNKDNEGRKTAEPTPPSTIHSPPKPPVPEPTGPKQYGLMKVHHPDSVRKLVAGNERDRASEKPLEKHSPHLRRAPSPHREVKRDAAPPTTLPPPPSEPLPSQDPKLDEHGSQWRASLNVSNSYSPWSNSSNLAPTPPSVKNPWKPLSSDRTLGNGIFDQGLGGFPSRDLPLRSQLGLDQATMSAQKYSGPRDSPSLPNIPASENRSASRGPLSPIGRPGRPGRPGPIGPPSSQRQQEPGTEAVGAWNNFQTVASQRESDAAAEFTRQFKVKIQAEHDDRERSNPVSAAPASTKHVWKSVQSSTSLGDRRPGKGGKTNTTDKDDSLQNSLTELDVSVDGLPFKENTARPLASVPARPLASVLTRSSRFFPHGTEQPKQSTAEKHDRPQSLSPPPPDEISTRHPVYFPVSPKRLVHLPAPKPIVRLPPKPLAAADAVPAPPVVPAEPPTFASMAAAPPRAVPAPVNPGLTWQDKFNGLFGKKTTPEKTNPETTTTEKKSSLAVASATKVPLDVQLPRAAVSVSLPTTEQGVQLGDCETSIRKVEEEEAIFEDREPGSQPGVRVPNMAPAAAWLPMPAPPPSAKHMKPVVTRRVKPFSFDDELDESGHALVRARLPGALAAKTFVLPKKPATQSPRQRSSLGSKSRKGIYKPRETTAGGSNTTKRPSSQKTGVSSSSLRQRPPKESWSQPVEGDSR